MHTPRQKNQQESFRISVKTRLVALGLSVVDLADGIGRSRETVSRAINQGRFPKVQNEIRFALGL